MANMEIKREDIFNTEIDSALSRISALKSSDPMESEELTELKTVIQVIRFQLLTMISEQVVAYGGVISSNHDKEPLVFSFPVAQDETDFNAWLDDYGSDTMCPVKITHSAPPVVECWQRFEVNLLEDADSGDITFLEDVITIINPV